MERGLEPVRQRRREGLHLEGQRDVGDERERVAEGVDHGRAERGVVEVLHAEEPLVHELVADLLYKFPQRDLTVDCEKNLWLAGSWSQVGRALFNLVTNAFEASPRGGMVVPGFLRGLTPAQPGLWEVAWAARETGRRVVYATATAQMRARDDVLHGVWAQVRTLREHRIAHRDLRVANVFHAGDGNLHPLILYDGRQVGALERAEVLAAEKLAAVAEAVAGQPYPAGLEQAWKSVLFNQFHDILAGTSVEAAYEDARDLYGEANAIAGRGLNKAIQSLAWNIHIPPQEGATPIVIFNPHAWPAKVSIELEFGRIHETDRLVDDSGCEIPLQRVQSRNLVQEERALSFRGNRERSDQSGG